MPSPPKRYTVHGFHIVSEFPLPACPADTCAVADAVSVRLCGERPVDQLWQPSFAISDILDISIVNPDSWIARCHQSGIQEELFMRVSSSGEICVTHRGTVSLGDIGRLVTSIGLRVLAVVRGLPVLHGSVLRMGTKCFALLGSSGSGKSTTTAALLRAGAHLITEELIVLDPIHAKQPAIVRPGSPYISIEPKLLTSLPSGTHIPMFERPGPGQEKVLWKPESQEKPLPSRLDAICVLGPRLAATARPDLVLLGHAEATAELGINSYWADKVPEKYWKDFRKNAFLLAAELPVYRLHLPNDLGALFASIHDLSRMLNSTHAVGR